MVYCNFYFLFSGRHQKKELATWSLVDTGKMSMGFPRDSRFWAAGQPPGRCGSASICLTAWTKSACRRRRLLSLWSITEAISTCTYLLTL